MTLSYEEAKAAVVTWKLTGQFTPGMKVMVDWPFPTDDATVYCDDGGNLVEVYTYPGEFDADYTRFVKRSRLRPFMLK